MSVRKVTHIGKNIIGGFPSIKVNRMVAFESTIERDYIHLLEFDAEVRCFEEQPLTIEYSLNGKVRHYTPDFKVETTDGFVLVECKPQVQVTEERNQIKFKAANVWCAERGWTFEVVTDAEVRGGCYLSNVKTLFRHAHRKVTNDTRRHCERILSDAPCAVRELARRIDSKQAASIEADLLCLAFHHVLRIDTTGGFLTGDSLLSLDGGQV